MCLINRRSICPEPEACPLSRLDASNRAFKFHQMEQLGTQWRETRFLDVGSLAQVPEQPAAQAGAHLT